MKYLHQPVLVHEVVRYLVTLSDGLYVDGTVGCGGHSEAIGRKITAQGRLICLDRDPEAIRISRERLSPLRERVTLARANYAELNGVLQDLRFKEVNGVFLDLGMSSYQLEYSRRGFSFSRDEPLDMRMDPDDDLSAYQLVNNLSQRDLERILRNYGEEKMARSIAKSIDRERRKEPIDSSLHLANLIRSVVPRSHRPGAKHPATRTFQAIRIAVNRELENLDEFLDKVPSLISKGGRLVILAYHSLEDRMVKKAIIDWERGCSCPPDLPRCACGKKPLFKRLHKRAIKPDQQEIEDNPRARSAILRAAERI